MQQPIALYGDMIMRKLLSVIALLLVVCVVLAACGNNDSAAPKDNGEPFYHPTDEKDFSKLRTPGSQEEAYTYKNFFIPGIDGINQPYVGDTMPYYENGVYYIYYLKEGGDSYNHSAYLATTTDFVTYTEYDNPVLEANRAGGQDGWIGTGSVVKVKDDYYFFYTGHASGGCEYAEKVMVAKGSTPTAFEKVEGWDITPPYDDLHQKQDFRDPQAYYNAENDTIELTITASKDGTARILKYTLSSDLKTANYDGIIFTNPVGKFWNLECSDTFKMGNTYYITYSAQDDTLWYAKSETAYGPYSAPVRLDGKLFYAAKHVENETGSYMVGWARRSESASSTSEVTAWGGNMAAQKIQQLENGDLMLVPVDTITAQFDKRRELPVAQDAIKVESGARYSYFDAFTAYESYMLKGKFTYTGKGSFGLAFDYNGKQEKYKTISLDPASQSIQLLFNEGDTLITETPAALEAGKEYTFTYVQEGSVGIFYVDGVASLTARLYGVTGKTVRLFAENNSVSFTGLREYTR